MRAHSRNVRQAFGEKKMNMHRWVVRSMLLLAVTGTSAVYAADMPGPVQPEEIKWGAAPPVLPAGAKMAVLAGDPAGTGLVTVRLKLPPGYKIPAHWHPTDEHVTVISGTLALGMGDVLDEKKSKTLKVGGYGVAPANMHHFAWTKTGGVVQVHLMGPFQITYVNPADDPSKKK
jgi:quercetin dioxygenase-like cupin family protein